MRLSAYLRPVALSLSLIALAFAAGCSGSGGDNNSSGTSKPGGSQREYCAAVKTLFDMTQQFSGSTVPAEQAGTLRDAAAHAADVAPSEVRNDFYKTFLGDSYARDNVDLYNKNKCGIDTSSMQVPSP